MPGKFFFQFFRDLVKFKTFKIFEFYLFGMTLYFIFLKKNKTSKNTLHLTPHPWFWWSEKRLKCLLVIKNLGMVSSKNRIFRWFIVDFVQIIRRLYKTLNLFFFLTTKNRFKSENCLWCFIFFRYVCLKILKFLRLLKKNFILKIHYLRGFSVILRIFNKF